MPPPNSQDVAIQSEGIALDGILSLPDQARGIVVFVHGSGSSRLSRRNGAVARSLNDRGLGTLLFDLLTAEEEEVDRRTREHRFDIELLARRLSMVTRWLRDRSGVPRELPLGYFGSSTGAAAAIVAAAEHPQAAAAVVSRGGRPDLAGPEALRRLDTPTLLIVGGRDTEVIELNERARREMHRAPVSLVVVPDATHLFEEPGTLAQAAQAAGKWFVDAFDRRRVVPRPRRDGRFTDRIHAGELLANQLRDQLDRDVLGDALVVGMPRGGVPVAKVVADELDLQLTAVFVRKLGAPGHPEYGIGAIAEDGIVVIDERSARLTGAEGPVLERLIESELAELERRRRIHLGGSDQPSFEGRVTILVDDGLATGVTARAAGRLLRHRGASSVLLAVPVCSPSSVERLQAEFDGVVCVELPSNFRSVGDWYEQFDSTTDAEVIEALQTGAGD